MYYTYCHKTNHNVETCRINEKEDPIPTIFEVITQHIKCRNPTLAKCRGESQHSQSWGLGVLWDS